jgi:hypothetical protein
MKKLLLASFIAIIQAIGLSSSPANAVTTFTDEFVLTVNSNSFTLTNNSGTVAYPGDFYVWGFAVGLPNSSSASTTLPTWNAYTFNPSAPNTELEYINSTFLNLPTDIGPNSFSNAFLFVNDPPSLPFTLNLVDTNGQQFSYDSQTNTVAPVPEASTWTMMILGFLGLGFLGFRRTRLRGSWASAA